MEGLAKSALIVGPPRTGTSLAASIFANAGYHVGPIDRLRYREGDDHNPFGYFEADLLTERNVSVLRRAGFPHHNTWTSGSMSSAQAGRIYELEPTDEDRRFVEGYEEEAPWLWKDPRLCFTLPYWWKLLDAERVHVLLVTRNLEDVYHSFRRKEWCGRGTEERRATMDLVEQHFAAARRGLRILGIPYTTVDYQEYATSLDDVALRLADAYRIEITPEDVNYHPELDHSGLRGRISGYIRKWLKRLPRGPVDRISRLIPRRLLGILFPERLHTDHPS